MRTLPQDGSSDTDRSTIDEALFTGEGGFYPSSTPELPAEVVFGTLANEPPASPSPEVPSWLRIAAELAPTTDSPSCGAVRDGGAEYQMTGLAPGLFELRVVSPPAPAAARPLVGDEEGEPDQYEAVPIELPTREPCTLEASTGLSLTCGEEATITPAEFRIGGPVGPQRIEVLVLAAPAHGALLRDGFALAAGDTFTQQDVEAGRLRYRHDGGEAREDRFTFATPDGEVQPALFTFSIRPAPLMPCLDLDAPGPLVADDGPPLVEADALPPEQDEQPPHIPCALQVNLGLSLACGEEVTISPAELRITGREPIEVLVLAAPTHGALLRDGFALAAGDTFTQQDVEAGRLRYRHDGGEAREDRFTFATPDGEVQPTVFVLAVEPNRRAPELLGPGQLGAILHGCRVADVLADQGRCHEPDQPAGLALVAVAGRGKWYCSLDGLRTWLELAPLRPGQARLLGPDDGLRFVPRPGWSGTVKVGYRAWDGSTGQPGDVVDLSGDDAIGGTTAFSVATAVALLHLPPPLTAATVDPCREEPTLAELIGDGFAVVRLEGEGSWQYSLDDGRTWRPFGTVYHGRAHLLRAADRVRFLPRRGATGKVLLAGRAWDGRGGAPGGMISLAARSSHGDGTPFGEFVQTRTWWLRDE